MTIVCSSWRWCGCLSIVGEAATRVPEEECVQYPGIPWPEIVGLRNRLNHGYDAVDLDILWQIIVHDLPSLITTLETMVVPSDLE